MDRLPVMNDSNRTESGAQAVATPNPAAKRVSGLQLLHRVKQFAVRLNANARWMKQFLHGSR